MIDVINLRKSFGDKEILKGINVTINKGDIVAVLGPSGSGKSTFLRCLNCMEDPTGGSIIFNGVDIADMKVDINVHRRHMGMVFQHFNLFNNKTVLQNVMMAPEYLQCRDLKKAKRANRRIQFKNVFRGKDKKEAVAIAHKTSMLSIVTSGCSFFACTFGISVYSQVDMIGSICTLLARGAIISMVVVILILPAMFMIFDKLICKTSIGFLKKKTK